MKVTFIFLAILSCVVSASPLDHRSVRSFGASPLDHRSVRSFSVIALGTQGTNAVDIGVEIIPGKFYTMKTYPYQSDLLHQVDIPVEELFAIGGTKYRYVLLEPKTHTVKDTEPFERYFSVKGRGLNDFYGREETVYEDAPTLPDAEDRDLLPLGFYRTRNTLHRYNEIVTLHIVAPSDQVEQMHTNYKDDIHIKGTMTYISSDTNRTFEGCTFSIGGRSSKRFTKLPYKFTLGENDDLGGYRKFKLRTTASDPSYLREKLAYDIHSAAGRPISKASYVRLFINDQAIGLFLFAESYDKIWLQNEFGGDEGKGVLYKAQGPLSKDKIVDDLSYYPDDLASYDTMFAVEEGGKNKKDKSDLLELIEFIDQQLKWQENKKDDNETLDGSVELWESHLNVKGTLTNLALEFLLGTWDNYIQNAQNYYLYKPSKDTPMDWLAWDFDYSFGNGPVHMDRLVTGDYHNFTGMLTRPVSKALLAIPAFRDQFEKQLTYIVKNIMAPSITTPWIDQWVKNLKMDILWDQSLPRVRSGKSYDEMTHLAGGGSGSEGMTLPPGFSVEAGMDFMSRVNSDVSLREAIEGPSCHDSLIPLKEFIQKKTEGVIRVSSS